MRKVVSTILVVFIIVSGIQGCTPVSAPLTTTPNPTPAASTITPTATPTLSPTPTPAPTPNAVVLTNLTVSTTTLEVDGVTCKYSIDMPVISTKDADLYYFLSAYICAPITVGYAEYRNDYRQLLSDGMVMDQEGYSSQIDDLSMSREYLQVVGSNCPLAGAGDPHENYAFVIDLKNRKKLSLFDIFANGQSSKDSLLSLVNLKLQYQEEGYNTDYLENLTEKDGVHFLMNREGVLLIFDPYIVAVGATGTVYLFLSYDEINEPLAISKSELPDNKFIVDHWAEFIH